ncbi:hypothetical protein DMP17_24630 [Pseudonocardia sp. TMWB2A]|uniref:hypothetical protein n=1 Tax=Pseudonocardia sp. TMWB2A TaxID=687430 RepID=UPI00307DB157
MSTDRAVDEPAGVGQVWRIDTAAWWSGHPMTPRGVDPQVFLDEQLITEWVPTEPASEWMCRREMTGRRVWLAGSEAAARAAGVDRAPMWPVGQWRAPFGDYFAVPDRRPAAPPDGWWSFPTPEFLAGLPRTRAALDTRLRADSAASGGVGNDPFGLARRTLGCGRVTVDLRGPLLEVVDSLSGVRRRPGPAGTVLYTADVGDVRSEMLVDADTGDFRGSRDVLLRPDASGCAAGTTVSATSVRTTVVDRLGGGPEPHGAERALWPGLPS